MSHPENISRSTGVAARFAAVVVLSHLAATACIDPESPLVKGSSEGCDEFQPGEPVDPRLDVHPKVRAFMQASSDFAKNATAVRANVLEACAHVAMDLGGEDTWSKIADPGDAISNASGTGACDAAGARVEEVLTEAGQVNATVALLVTRGECHLDFEMQKQCEGECTANAVCDSGTVETRCEPGSLSVVCGGACTRDAFCVGTLEVATNCKGKCEAECTGECTGECIKLDGEKTMADPNCSGKCSEVCTGSCRGKCKVEVEGGIACGASTRCTGGCLGTYSEPSCVSEFTPPICEVDAECIAACDAKVAAAAVCDPPSVRVHADVAATPRIQPLVDTLQGNLPKLLDAANEKGKLLLSAARRMGDAGEKLEAKVEDLDGKSLACLAAASTEVGKQIGAVDVSLRASVDITVNSTGITE